MSGKTIVEYADRLRNLLIDLRDLQEDISILKKEMKGEGHDVRAMLAVVKMELANKCEDESVHIRNMALYADALGVRLDIGSVGSSQRGANTESKSKKENAPKIPKIQAAAPTDEGAEGDDRAVERDDHSPDADNIDPAEAFDQETLARNEEMAQIPPFLKRSEQRAAT